YRIPGLSFHTDVLDLTLTVKYGIFEKENLFLSVRPVSGSRQERFLFGEVKNGFCCIVSAASINTGTPGSWCVCFSVFSDCRKRGSAWLVRT
ncbi:hypothetical protein, partial [Faecalibaculum rodentium]|uniref:hypothetical protein n=1 Tax=Faecalibaculum rodentium TaxID=1702221 RepID=UPI0025B1AEE3